MGGFYDEDGVFEFIVGWEGLEGLGGEGGGCDVCGVGICGVGVGIFVGVGFGGVDVGIMGEMWFVSV